MSRKWLMLVAALTSCMGHNALTWFNDDLPTWRGYVAAQLDVTG